MAFSTWDGVSTLIWSKGDGSQSNPYVIETAENLAYLANSVNDGEQYSGVYFKLGASIDLNGYEWTPIGESEATAFSGVFDGGNRVVYNLNVTGERSLYGLFGCVANGAVTDIALENCNIEIKNSASITNDIYAGAIAAYINKPAVVIKNCYATGKTVVRNQEGNECEVFDSHKLYEGGLFGGISDGTVKLCYNRVDFSAAGNGSVGGVAGCAVATSFTECYNKAVIRGKACHAGILGESVASSNSNKNSITGCYNTGEIVNCDEPDANNYNGGICGYAGYTDIKNCYTVGLMTNFSTAYKNYCIGLNQSTSSRNSIFCLKDITGTSISDTKSNGSRATKAQLQASNAPQLIGTNFFQLDVSNSFNDGYCINLNGISNIVTDGATFIGEGSVVIDGSAYAHNNCGRGFWWGEADSPNWTQHSTADSILNHYKIDNLEYGKKYGYSAYHKIRGSSAVEEERGADRYFIMEKGVLCYGTPYSYHGKKFTMPGYYEVEDGDTTYLLDLRIDNYKAWFYNDDGSQLLCGPFDVPCGKTPEYTCTTPEKPSETEDYIYIFSGWNPPIGGISADTKYYAVFDKSYKVKFENYDGTLLQESYMDVGEIPVPPAAPERPSTAEYTYTFSGWEPEVVAVTEAATYTATYTATKNKYKISFINYDGAEIESFDVEYGEMPVPPAIPERPSTVEYTYTFSGWEPEVVAVTGAATYTATYTATKNKYKISFINYDGAEIESFDVEYGEIPVPPAAPERPEENYSIFRFCKWLPSLAEVTGNATYKAYYSAKTNLPTVSNCYTYTWKNRTTKVTTTLVYSTKTIEGKCDSIVYQHVVIKDSTIVVLPTVGDCYEYTWEGQTTRKSTVFRKVDIGQNECDSITYQPVVIYDKPEVFINDTISPGVVYNRNGFDLKPINELGEYEFEKTDKSIYGCDSTTILILQVVPNRSIPIQPAKYVQYIGGRFNWQIKNAESFPNMRVAIFDRNGRKLIEYRGYSNSDGWDGHYNGHILPATDYWYWIKDDYFGIVTGHFTLQYDHKW